MYYYYCDRISVERWAQYLLDGEAGGLVGRGLEAQRQVVVHGLHADGAQHQEVAAVRRQPHRQALL
jgi:hypothetical protein